MATQGLYFFFMLRRNTRNLDDGPVHLTEDGLIKMKKHLAELKASLPYLISETSEAAAQGDRSDNDAYKQSKGLLRRTYRQIWSIEDQLKRVVIITPGRNTTGTIQLGSQVTLETDKKEKVTFEIVGSRETNPEHGRISYKSPLGKTLLGHQEGNIVTIEAVAGKRSYKILEVR